jgi:CBS domain-containing protein
MERVPIPTAREIMRTRLHTVSPETDLEEAVRSLLARKHSGAPVVDSAGKLVGVLSEYDCLSILAQAAAERWQTGCVADRMTKEIETVGPKEDVLALSTRFCQGRHRRLLVVEDDKLVGLISRSDLLRALERVVKALGRAPRQGTYDAVEKRHIALD